VYYVRRFVNEGVTSIAWSMRTVPMVSPSGEFKSCPKSLIEISSNIRI